MHDIGLLLLNFTHILHSYFIDIGAVVRSYYRPSVSEAILEDIGKLIASIQKEMVPWAQ